MSDKRSIPSTLIFINCADIAEQLIVDYFFFSEGIKWIAERNDKEVVLRCDGHLVGQPGQSLLCILDKAGTLHTLTGRMRANYFTNHLHFDCFDGFSLL
jgi:hypothetical protein